MSVEHRDRRTKAPPELGIVHLLLDPHLARVVKLVPEAEERVLEREVEAVLRAVRELKQRARVAAPVVLPRAAPRAHAPRGARNVRDRERAPRGHERREAVVEVRQQQDRPRRERLQQRGLVHAVERARLHVADPATRALVPVYIVSEL